MMTLDKAEAAFEATPTNTTAGRYLIELMVYEADGMIGDDTFLDGLACIAGYLVPEFITQLKEDKDDAAISQ